jgi:lipopolysaccharide transport system ATP-binding protein
MSDLAIRVENLSKRYHIGRAKQRHDTLRDALMAAARAPVERLSSLMRRPSEDRSNGREPDDGTIWALRDVSFEVKRGEVVGVIGRNGAGKSTLLKILSRITEPTSGRAEIHGRVGSLLEVGTGFHPELTGRENVYLSGAILGMRRTEIDRKFEEIVDFSGVEKFIDTPFKRYSSGMRVRLGFAVAAHLDPEILLVDEVLAVGDAAFQKKCLGKMGEVAGEGRTVVFVSHQMDMIGNMCSWCILLSNGLISLTGDSQEVIGHYINSLITEKSKTLFEVEEDKSLPIQVVRGSIVDKNGKTQNRFDVFEEIALELECVVHKPVEGAIVNFELKRNGTTLFFSFDSDTDFGKLNFRHPKRWKSRITLPCPLLKPGHYSITVGTGIANKNKIQHLENAISFDVDIFSKPSTFLSYAAKRPGVIAVPLEWRNVMSSK